MLERLFASLYGTTITIPAFLIVSALSLVLGFAIALCHRRTAGASGSMSGALTFLPFLVQLVILLVNGNLGAGGRWRGPSASSASAPPPAPPGTSPSSFWP